MDLTLNDLLRITVESMLNTRLANILIIHRMRHTNLHLNSSKGVDFIFKTELGCIVVEEIVFEDDLRGEGAVAIAIWRTKHVKERRRR